MKLPSFNLVAREAGAALRRFPLVILDAFGATIVAVLIVDHAGAPEPTVLFKILFGALLGLPLLISIAVWREGKNIAQGNATVAHLVGILLVAGYALTVPSDLFREPAIYTIRFFMLLVAAHLLVSVAPFVGKEGINGFWHFNKTLFLRVLIALLFSFVLWSGLSLALAALSNLFGMNVPPKRYPELWFVILGVFNTWFFLAGIPPGLEELESRTDYPKALKVFAQYIVFPLVVVYGVILYVYLGKILFTWDWPQGWVSKLILGFSSAGLFSLVFLYPLRRSEENRWIAAAWRWFFFVLPPIIVMLFLALTRRIAEYALTEGRCLALVLGGWLAFMTLYFIISKRQNIKLIPGTLCILALTMAYGPWSAFTIAENSQVARLKMLLEKDSILVNGMVRKTDRKVSFEDRKEISAIISYLHQDFGYEKIQPWFSQSLRIDSASTESAFRSPADVAVLAGVEYINIWMTSTGDEVSMHMASGSVMDICGYTTMLPVQNISGGGKDYNFHSETFACRMNVGMDSMVCYLLTAGVRADSLMVDLRPLVGRLLNEYKNSSVMNIPAPQMAVLAEDGRMKVKLYLRHIQVKRTGKEFTPESYEVILLYTIGGTP